MSIERISTIQTASVINQPVDAVERLTLVKKLQAEIECCEHEYAEFDEPSNDLRIAHLATIGGLSIAISIAKQHSDWVSVSELKLTEDDYGKDFIAYECEYFKTTGRATYQDGGYWRFDCARGYCASANISHVIPIPKFQPPSEVQDAI